MRGDANPNLSVYEKLLGYWKSLFMNCLIY